MSEELKKDSIFAAPFDRIGDFDFGEETALVFDDMLRRSVPFYAEMQRMIAELVPAFLSDESRVYDLGCSTGTTIAAIAQTTSGRKVQFVGIDNSPSMLELARKRISSLALKIDCELQLCDLNESLNLEPHDICVSVLTLQFVRPLQRATVLEAVYQQLKRGGCFLVVEKILADDSLVNRMFIDRYYDFKRRQGYSELEIAQKREALENVLIPYRVSENIAMLRQAGFTTVEEFFRWYNFAGFLAVKR